jgi:hypothetical protein
MMTQVEQDTVRTIIKDFMSKDLLFTALDVSNEAKKTMPHLRHGEVREIVRETYATDMQVGWARSNIDVTLEDGSQRQALLYYPLSASWDLDSLYDAQKRAQTSVKPAAAQSIMPDPLATTLIQPNIANNVVNTAQPTTTAAPLVNTNHVLWQNMFQSKPSLFPLK